MQHCALRSLLHVPPGILLESHGVPCSWQRRRSWQLTLPPCNLHFSPPQHVGPVLKWLARQPMVYWLAPRMQHTWDNLAASAVTQGAPAVARAGRAADAAADGLHPIWAAGLRGEGQVVGVGDSGVDMDSCYFYDPKVRRRSACALLLFVVCCSQQGACLLLLCAPQNPSA